MNWMRTIRIYLNNLTDKFHDASVHTTSDDPSTFQEKNVSLWCSTLSTVWQDLRVGNFIANVFSEPQVNSWLLLLLASVSHSTRFSHRYYLRWKDTRKSASIFLYLLSAPLWEDHVEMLSTISVSSYNLWHHLSRIWRGTVAEEQNRN